MNSRDSSPVRGAKKNTASNVIIFIICVLIAFSLWVYVMLTESPDNEQIFHHLQVELTNTDVLAKNGLSIYGGYGNLIDVTLAGSRSVLSKLTNQDIIVTADTSNCTDSGRFDCVIKVDVPPGCKLVGKSQETVNVYVDDLLTKNVALTEQRENTNLPEGCSTGTIVFPVDHIQVEGPRATVSRIEKAKVVVDLANVTKTTEFLDVPIIFVDANDTKVESTYLEYATKTVSFTVPVVKKVTVPLNVVFQQDYLSLDTCAVTLTPAEVTVTGEPDVIDRGSLIENIYIDEMTAFDKDKATKYGELSFTKDVTVGHVAGVTVSPAQVNLSAVANSRFKVRVINIPSTNVEGSGGTVNYEWVNVNNQWDNGSSVEIVLIGPVNVLRQIDVADVTLRYDMSPFSETSAGSTVSANAWVEIEPPFKDQVLALGSYTVSVKIADD